MNVVQVNFYLRHFQKKAYKLGKGMHTIILSILNKKTLKETFGGKTQLSGVTNINCKEHHFILVYRSAVLQDTCSLILLNILGMYV